MTTARPFTINLGSTISGTTQVGDIAVATDYVNFGVTGLQWYNGPDEDLGYIICTTNPNIVTKNLVLNLDSRNINSYSSGTTWYDLSVNGNNNGAIVSGITYINNGLYFSGNTDNYVRVLDSNSLNFDIGYNEFTVSLWINCSGQTASYPAIIGKGINDFTSNSGLGWLLYYNNANNYIFNISESGHSDSVTFAALDNGNWYNIVAVVSTTTVTSYLNAVLKLQIPRTVINTYNNTDLIIGKFNTYWKGYISDVKIYNRALSATEIVRNFNGIQDKSQEWYGIQRDSTSVSSTWTRIGGNMSLHNTLPVHNLLQSCLVTSGKTVNYYLNPTDWSKKLDGSASNLTGVDGDVMVRKTAPTYWQFTTVDNIQTVKCSLYNLPGFYQIPTWNYSAYEGVVSGSSLKSISGVLPTTSINLTNCRTYARNNGTGYNQQLLEPYSEIIWLAIIEFATFNMQLAVNATLDGNGYRRGGMGNGVTTAVTAEWNAYNGYNPFIYCGTSNSLASGTGEVSTVITNFGGAGVNRTFTVPRYRGIENIFGHIWKWIDGVYFNSVNSTQYTYVYDDPANIVDNSSGGTARYIGNTPVTSNYIQSLIFDSKGCILPLTVGGSSTVVCEYYYAPTINTGWYALVCGGSASHGGYAGPFYASTIYRTTNTFTYFGSRLLTN
jgi:hypothetical protein